MTVLAHRDSPLCVQSANAPRASSPLHSEISVTPGR
jgi:hypothetical protein